MLSVGSMGGSGAYYLQLAREDYYLQGGEPLGQWWGRGADTLSYSGNVSRDDLKSLIKGFDQDGKALVQNAGHTDRQQGWDLTFSAPKSVSVLWSQADSITRQEIQAAHAEGVKAALEYLQDDASFTRRGKEGTVQERAGLAVATFEHGTSRDLDPQLHTHALVLNVATRDDGSTGTLLSKPVYQSKMVAGALYRAELATQLETRLGLRCEREKNGAAFTVAGVPEKLCEEFSKRRAAIEERLHAYGSQSAAASAAATLDTRRTKQDAPPRSELFKEWKKFGQAFGFDPTPLLTKEHHAVDRRHEARAVLGEALEKITTSHGHFTGRELLKNIAVEAQGRGLTAKELRDYVAAAICSEKRVVSLGQYAGENRYTTPEMMKAERALIESADKLAANTKHGVASKHVEKVLESSGRRLTDEQRDAVRHVTEKGGGGLRSLEGLAGTGKTSTLSIAREVWEAKGYTVLGAALSAKAAKELKYGAGIPSITIARLQKITAALTFKDVLKHEAIQVVRALDGMHRYNQTKPFQFDAKTVLVIDEAAMVATKELAKIAAAVEKAGGMLVSVFDRKQLQAIGPGGGAAYLADRHGKAELSGIVRQNEEWMRDAVKQFSKGDAKTALGQFALAGRLRIEDNRDRAVSALVSDWADRERGKREGSLIFVGTREEVRDVNTRCQAARKERGELGDKAVEVNGQRFYRDDRVLFTKNSKTIDVQNGSLGTVIGVNTSSNIAIVKLDGGGVVNVVLSRYKDVQLGYAITTHKGQGTTVENAYLLAGGKMQDLHLSYVQASRAKESTHIYTDKHEAGEQLTQLTKQMQQEREKTLAHEIADRVKREQQVQQRQTITITQDIKV